MNVDCLMWCSAEGDVPEGPDEPIDDSLVESLLEATSVVKKLELKKMAPIEPLCSYEVYQITNPHQSEEKEGEEKEMMKKKKAEKTRCEKSQTMKWYGEDNCIFRMICTHLETESVCGDFGLQMKASSGVENEVCHAKVPETMELTTWDLTEVTAWWFNASKERNINCYFWCTVDGEVPLRPQSAQLQTSLLEQNVRFNEK